MKHFLHVPLGGEDVDRSIDMAIQTVGQANNDQLTHMLIEYLMGEPDGVPKVRFRVSACLWIISLSLSLSLPPHVTALLCCHGFVICCSCHAFCAWNFLCHDYMSLAQRLVGVCLYPLNCQGSLFYLYLSLSPLVWLRLLVATVSSPYFRFNTILWMIKTMLSSVTLNLIRLRLLVTVLSPNFLLITLSSEWSRLCCHLSLSHWCNWGNLISQFCHLLPWSISCNWNFLLVFYDCVSLYSSVFVNKWGPLFYCQLLVFLFAELSCLLSQSLHQLLKLFVFTLQ